MKTYAVVIAAAVLPCAASVANAGAQGSCALPDSIIDKVQNQLAVVVALPDANGGLFKPNRMWSAIVDRAGRICSVKSIGDAWPGSRAIAIAKASTANDFSNDALALSTANLYAPTQPEGSLYGLNNSNPFNPAFLPQGSLFPAESASAANTGLEGAARGKVPGGIITFGGGVALYANGKVVGGLGVSGDTSCADHAIAYRMRRAAGFGIVPSGVAGGTDNILYAPVGTTPTGFQQPHCDPSKDIVP